MVQGSGERGGAERALSVLALGLPAHGFDPLVVCHADGPFPDELRSAGVAVVAAHPLPRVRSFRSYRAAVAEIAGVARRHRAAVVQGNGERAAVFSSWAARACGARSVQWLHDAPLRDGPSVAAQLVMAVAPADARVAGSQWMAREFRRLLRLDVRTIRCGVDLNRLPTRPAEFRSAAGWPEASPVVGFFGRLQSWKGPDVFLRAAAEVAASVPECRFLVAGGALYGWEEGFARSLPALAVELGVGDRVWFAGHRADALELMAGCQVVVHSSLRPEPLGIVVTEAMALGRPVVATRTRGPEEVITDGRNGFLVQPGDHRSVATVVVDLLRSPARRAEIGAAATVAAQGWSAEVMVRGFADLYREMGVGA